MTESEIGDVSRLLGESYRWLGEREKLSPEQVEFLVSQRGSQETVRRESRHERYLVADSGTELIGVVSVARDEITKLYVRPSSHGGGVGRELYEAAESIIASDGHRRVTLGAFRSAVPFYESMGLRVVGQKRVTGKLSGVVITLMEKVLTDAPSTRRVAPV
jgi:GNAT superfamily N-acetyltransferase